MSNLYKLTLMRQLLIGLMIISLAACKKSSSSVTLVGVFTESTPVTGRSQLNFIEGNLVVKSEIGSNFKSTFKYSITQTKIILTPTWRTQDSGQEFDFEKFDDNSFKIENLYPSLPMGPKSYMTFKK
jgi:hypothetical protein